MITFRASGVIDTSDEQPCHFHTGVPWDSVVPVHSFYYVFLTEVQTKQNKK